MNRSDAAKAGDSLEFLASSIFQSQGFLVRRSVPLKLGATTDLTDIDVFAIKFVYPFQPVTLICDCKDRDRSQANSRVFWAKGLGACIGASEIYVACKSARLETVQFAKQNGVRVLTNEVLREFAAQGTVDSTISYSHAKRDTFEPLVFRVREGVSQDRSLKGYLDDSISAFQSIDPYEDFNYCLERIQKSTDVLSSLGPTDSAIRTAWSYVLANFVVALSVHLLYICADSLTLTKSDRKRHILQRLTFGSLPPAQAQAIVDASFRLAGETLAANKLDGYKPFLPSSRQLFRPPAYADDVVGLVERAISRPEMYHSLPQALDFILFDAGLVAGRFDSALFARTFPSIQGVEVLKATRNVFAFLRANSRFAQTLFFAPPENTSPADKELAVDAAVVESQGTLSIE